MEGEFKSGDHLKDWCNLWQTERLLSILSARKHSKSEMAHAYIAWRIYNMDYTYFEKWLYISYSEELAGEHLADTKERIRVNPFFQREGIQDLTDAKTYLYYKKGSRRIAIQPSGIMTFKRGKHPDGVITDDILRDPEVRLDISQIEKITQIFFEQVMSLPKEDGLGLKNIGTAQDREDLFHVLESRKQFSTHRFRAASNSSLKEPLWPQMFPTERLIQIRDDELGEKAFSKEYMCVPVRSAEGYFKDTEIDDCIHKRLRNRSIHKEVLLNEYCYGGLDIGKKRHPSHLSVFGKDRKGRLIQLISLWMDGTDYIQQLRNCKEVTENFKVFRLHYDNTRSEFEGFDESGDVPEEMMPVTFTAKLKHQMAADMEKEIKKGNVVLIDDRRQRNQLLNCDNNLKSMETKEGHGDSFWSNALAIQASKDTGEEITFI